jgi:hypothetical protein
LEVHRLRYYGFRVRFVTSVGTVVWHIGSPQSLSFIEGTRWRSWLRHCAKSRKVAVPIPNGVDSVSNRNEYEVAGV